MNDDSSGSSFHTVKGTVKRWLGWLTADRRVEAEGAAEEKTEAVPSESEVAREKHEIKKDYGETAGGPHPPGTGG